MDFKYNYDEKIKIIKKAELIAESEKYNVNFIVRELNYLHKLWKNDLGPVTKDQSELLEKIRKIENERSNPSIKKFFQKAKNFWKK